MRKSEEELVHVHMRMFGNDWEELKEYYKAKGVSNAVRIILRRHLKGLREHGEQIAKEATSDGQQPDTNATE